METAQASQAKREPRIHELAEKPGSSLHVVLQTLIKIEIKERYAREEIVMEAIALNIDASKLAATTQYGFGEKS
ncbi:hypothetical protein Pyn_37549 [Prunus yedoensis var. nudiflora]|uniref:Uncharacterized protein n=1 Tax=Prunus yedoensis var. nudiflora TaxID=2094558 RepID=A0A314UMG9_PRUYE|nr:hypothetical protein Pyn_37549 [Prunus yedoensis var. nudiflora]